MNRPCTFTIALCTLIGSALVHAQTNAPATRAEVRADIVRVEKAGYNPSIVDNAKYPDEILAAEAKIAREDDGQNANYSKGAVGGTMLNGATAAGAPGKVAQNSSRDCVGPRSFCNLYAGS
jgi:hypothetical protein